MTDHPTSEAAVTGHSMTAGWLDEAAEAGYPLPIDPMAAGFERYHSAGPATFEDLEASFKCLRDIIVDEVDFGIFTPEEALAVIEKLHHWLTNEALGRRRAITRQQCLEALAALPDWNNAEEAQR